ncbi:regulator of nonsense transcripts 3A isoform X1 [Homo sapiens]|uniref:regulator of nonsense transcripts 3A isoform X1 n=1 Tax=Homo sapiens TaxID=9606 RepID=UPI0005CFF370|nr:regulator of nonsense transcripts 3A isoform X1 [Homo sapiens]XP_054230841.1 regulator of nonsense transcripts 3A isoform X1 [Homo sapiens]|eukprot:XP_011533146.1 regulator of nonsense transcripts 3A isoform X1 [Homo sapiens]
MRSEKEGAGGLRAAVAARGPSGREKLSALEVQFHRDSQQQEAETPPTSSSGCGGGAGKPREEKRTALSKVVIRRLPPGLTKEQLEEQLRPLPAHDYFEFFAADLSLYPHLYSRAYINFRNPDDILLFRDRFDGYIFLDSKARRTTPLLEYIKNRKLEKQRIREEKREERRRRELEKKRLREEEKRRRREEERCKKKETDKQKKIAEKEVRIKLLKKPEKGEEPTTEKPKERGEEIDTGGGKQESCAPGAVVKARPMEGSLEEPQETSHSGSDKEHRDVERSQEQESEAQRYHVDDGRRHRAHHEPERLSRRSEDEQRWGKGPGQDRGKKGSQDSGAPGEAMERLGRAQRCDDSPAPRKERLANKDRPALQLYDPGARFRARECGGNRRICKAEGSGTGPEKREEAE